MYDVFVVGGLVLDLYGEFDIYPKEGEEVFSPSFSSGIGGTSYNVSRALVFNGHTPLLSAYIGDDLIGNLLKNGLEKRGIKTHLIVKNGIGTGTVFSVLTPHDRTMFTYRGADSLFSFTKEMVELAKGAQITYISSYVFMGKDDISHIKRFIEEVNPYTTIFLSVAKGVLNVRFDWFLEIEDMVDLIFMNEDEHILLSPYLSSSTPRVVTMGKRGVRYVKGDKEIFVPQKREITRGRFTGAGDAFCGGFISGVLKDLSIEGALELGNDTSLSWILYEFV